MGDSPGVFDEIERRWMLAHQPHPAISGPLSPGCMGSPISREWLDWLEVALHAQEDIQILLEGLAIAERAIRAATARIAEVEDLRREDADRYTDALRRVGEANLELRHLLDQALVERDDARLWAMRMQVLLRRLLASGIVPEGELLLAVREALPP
jgi:hypothetical protein